MQCARVREILSADLDGEAGGADRERATAHARQCPACADFSRRSMVLRRRLLHGVEVPDQTVRILAAVRRAEQPAPDRMVRALLAAVAVIEFVLAVAAFLAPSAHGHEIHRHTGFMYLALAAGFAVVARRPWRSAPGMLPMAAVLVACLLASTALDLAEGAASAAGALVHLACLSGLVGAWWLARPAVRVA